MKIFSSEQVKRWDAFTIREQQISSVMLMERAADACLQWLVSNGFTRQPIHIFCGKGNNGGDGLALARMLIGLDADVNVYILELGKGGSEDFQHNLQRLHSLTTAIHFIQHEAAFPVIEQNQLVVDALFGTGLNKQLAGLATSLVNHMNELGCPIISIDIPSGLFPDESSKVNTIIKAKHSLSFQTTKLAFLMPENDAFVGDFHLLNIGLSTNFEAQENSRCEVISLDIIKSIYKPRNKFSHKGSFGHAALIAGSYGMMGASVLAAKACLAAAVGKLTCHVPACGYSIMQLAVPEAMCKVSGEKYLLDVDEMTNYNSIGIGPGVGTGKEINAILEKLFQTGLPMVLDADALNVLAADPGLLSSIPAGTVITPHPKEFERLFGETSNDFERLELAIQRSSELQIYIILKGHYTAVITPRGKIYFNSNGNAGMAKAGMGDVLTGIVTALLARPYPLPEAAILAVFLHGLAGDIAASKYSMEAMQASDLVNCLSDAWKLLAE